VKIRAALTQPLLKTTASRKAAGKKLQKTQIEAAPQDKFGNSAEPKNLDISKVIKSALKDLPADLPQADPVQLTRVDQVRKAYGLTGKGVGIAVIDTGFAYPDYQPAAWQDTAEGSPTPNDLMGHGTHCAGDALNMAPEASIAAVKVMDKNFKISDSSMVKGIQWAIENKEKYGIKVISLSFGWIPQVEKLSSPPYFAMPQDLIGPAIEQAAKAGLTVVLPANSCGPGKYTLNQYADLKTPLVAGSADDENTVSWCSGRGPSRQGEGEIDILAPGHIASLNARNSMLEKNALSQDKIRAMSNPELRVYLQKNPKLLKRYKLPGNPEEISDETLEQFFRKGAKFNPETKKLINRTGNFELMDYLKNHPQLMEKYHLKGDPEKLPWELVSQVFRGGLNLSRLNSRILALPGTSFSTPIVAGIVALMYQADPDLTTQEIKSILRATARDMGEDKDTQGSGLIDAKAALDRVYQLKAEREAGKTS